MSVKRIHRKGKNKKIPSWDEKIPAVGVAQNAPVQDTRKNELDKFQVSDRKDCFAQNMGITNFRPSQLFEMAKIKKEK